MTTESKKTFEVEIRGFLTETEFSSRLADLKRISSKFEEDHRETTFFMIPAATLKVARLLSKNRAKIAYKEGDIVKSDAQEEIEIDIPPEQYQSAIEILTRLGHTDVQHTKQTRYNCLIDDIEISLKWSKDWGYHFEAETIVFDEDKIAGAKRYLEEQCLLLGLKAVDEEELEAFRQKIDAEHAQR